MYSCMQVIDAYINLLKAQEGLKTRTGGTVFLEQATITAFIKVQGQDNTSIEANCSNSKLHWVTRRALDYLDYDMV